MAESEAGVRLLSHRSARALAVALLLATVGLTGAWHPVVAKADVKPLFGDDQRLRFYGTELSGALFDGRSLIGRPAVLWFWTPEDYCGTCHDEAPIIARVAAANPRVAFVGIAGRSSIISMRRFVADNQLNFPNLTDANGLLWQSFFVAWPSAWAFLRPDGTGDLVNNVVGAMSEQELTDRVNGLTA
jgi:thiol-disulfide isomerase/thioredoxin